MSNVNTVLLLIHGIEMPDEIITSIIYDCVYKDTINVDFDTMSIKEMTRAISKYYNATTDKFCICLTCKKFKNIFCDLHRKCRDSLFFIHTPIRKRLRLREEKEKLKN